MLRLLSVRNFAVVAALEVELQGGFTVLTGETGAGKSILLDALSLLLGDRFETRQLRPGADRAEIAAEFDSDGPPELGAWLVAQDLADEGSLLLRRVLDAQGRSRAYVNGRPATLAQLAHIGERLIDLHGQHAHQSLLATSSQRAALDAFAGVDLGDLMAARATATDIDRQLVALGGDARARAREIDLLRFQIGEIAEAKLEDPNEDAGLEQEEELLADATASRQAA
ncbi:MAG: AAA family ATPase, partial [Casimicrobiaceae bacterium]